VEFDDIEELDLVNMDLPDYGPNAGRNATRKANNTISTMKQPESVRISNTKPIFSYATGSKPDLSHIHSSSQQGNYGSDEDFPSPSALLGIEHDFDYDDEEDFRQEDFHEGDFPLPSISSNDNGQTGIERMREDTPQVTTSFANGTFDFDAYEDEDSPPTLSPSRSSKKRSKPSDPAEMSPKKPRVERDGEQMPVVREEEVMVEEPMVEFNDVIGKTKEPVPEWAYELDEDIFRYFFE
jgi:hypothetical protein